MYATQQDIIELYGNDQLLLIADRDNDGEVDADIVARAINDAAAEMNVYIGKKYPPPLSEIPAVLPRICIDIVMYRLAATADVGTEERRLRYEDAVSLLKKIASGEVSLGIAPPPTSASGMAVIQGRDRLFNRDTMKNLL